MTLKRPMFLHVSAGNMYILRDKFLKSTFFKFQCLYFHKKDTRSGEHIFYQCFLLLLNFIIITFINFNYYAYYYVLKPWAKI